MYEYELAKRRMADLRELATPRDEELGEGPARARQQNLRDSVSRRHVLGLWKDINLGMRFALGR